MQTGHVVFVATSKPMLHMLLDDKPAMVGGAEQQLFLHAQHLVETGWRVTFLVGNYEETPAETWTRGMRVVKGPLPAPDGLTGRLAGLRSFWRLLRELDGDIYATRGLTGQAGIVAAYCRHACSKYIFWFGKDADAWYGDPKVSPLDPVEKRLAAYGIRNAFEVVVQSQHQSDLLSGHVGRRGYLVPNICPGNGQVVGTEGHEAHNGFTVLWAGSLQPKKRPEMVLEIADRLPEQRFVMIGGALPGTEEYAEGIVRQAEKRPNVDYQGFVPYAETHEHFARSSLFLNTSQPDLEGFPNTYLQAWSHGVPVVGTCDPDEVICRYALGRHCADAVDLAEAIMLFRSDSIAWWQTSLTARHYVHDHHRPEVVFCALDSLLNEAMVQDVGDTR